jgi:hypothetical protein
MEIIVSELFYSECQSRYQLFATVVNQYFSVKNSRRPEDRFLKDPRSSVSLVQIHISLVIWFTTFIEPPFSSLLTSNLLNLLINKTIPSQTCLAAG